MSINHDGFHATDGWYFERLEDGSVKISAAVNRCAETILLDPYVWASVIAAVSARGETGETWREAGDFHSRAAAEAKAEPRPLRTGDFVPVHTGGNVGVGQVKTLGNAAGRLIVVLPEEKTP